MGWTMMRRLGKRKALGWKAAAISIAGMYLLQPLAYADSSVQVLQAAGEIPAKAVQTAKPLEAKITKEQAVKHMIDLFPALKDATVSQVTLGDVNLFPPNPNVWNIQWEITRGSTSSSFSSRVDSQTGDLLTTSFPTFLNEQNTAFYPPKYSQDQAQDLAKAFIRKAVPMYLPTRSKLMIGLNSTISRCSGRYSTISISTYR
jgi:hypothetical protein